MTYPLARTYRVFRKIVVLLQLLGAGLLATSTSASAADLITLVRGSSYQLLENGDNVVVRLPFTLRAGISASQLTVETIDVALGPFEQGQLVQPINASVDAASANAGPAILLNIKADRGLRPGMYSMILLIRSSAAPIETQQVDLQINHPAAVLESPASVIIDRTVLFPWTKADYGPTSFKLFETSDLTRVSGLSITQARAANAQGDPVRGEVKVSPGATVEPRGTAIETVNLEGDFPIGTTSGQLRIDAVQLQTPTSLNFEVRSHLNVLWLFFAAAAGVITGALVRTWLKGRIALDDARVQAGEVLWAIEAELGRRPDRNFQREVKLIRDDLNQALEHGGAQTISAKALAAKAGLETKLADLATSSETERTTLELLALELDSGWTVPEPMRAVIATASTEVQAAAALLNADDVAGATDARVAATQKMVRSLQETAAQLAERLLPILDFLTSPAPPMDAASVPDSKTLASQMTDALNAAPLQRNPSAAPHDVLSAANDAEAIVRKNLNEVFSRMGTMATEVAAILQQGRPDDTAAINALTEAAGVLADEVQSGQEPDAKASTDIRLAMRDLLQRISEAILAQRKTASAADRKTVADLVAAGKYRDAATVIVAIGTERPLGDLVASAPPTTVPGMWRQLLAAPGALGTVVGRIAIVDTSSTMSPIALRLHRSRRSLLWAQLVQATLLGVVFMVGAYLLYAPPFFGTPTELCAIFLWAFGIDLTVDAVLNAVKGTGSAGATTVAVSGPAPALAGK